MRFVFHGVVVYNCTQYIKRLFLNVLAAKVVFCLHTNYNKCCNI